MIVIYNAEDSEIASLTTVVATATLPPLLVRLNYASLLLSTTVFIISATVVQDLGALFAASMGPALLTVPHVLLCLLPIWRSDAAKPLPRLLLRFSPSSISSIVYVVAMMILWIGSCGMMVAVFALMMLSRTFRVPYFLAALVSAAEVVVLGFIIFYLVRMRSATRSPNTAPQGSERNKSALP